MSNCSTTFVYRPQSGDRVFACHPTADIVVVEWANGCRHVVGGVKLAYHTAGQGQWWRTAARAMADAIIPATGGVAWDCQGEVSLVVPCWCAVEVHRRMVSARPHHDEGEDDRKEAALVVAGAALFYAAEPEGASQPDGRYGLLRRLQVAQAAVVRPTWIGYHHEEGIGVTLAAADSEVQVRAPWRLHSCSAPRLPGREVIERLDDATGVTIEDAVKAGYCWQGVLDWVASNLPGRESITVGELRAISTISAQQKDRILAAVWQRMSFSPLPVHLGFVTASATAATVDA